MNTVVAHVARSNPGTTHFNKLVRRISFFELAVPIIAPRGANEPYPAEDAELKLTSKGGYERSFKISEGVRTDDDFCSFRFYDITAKQRDDDFTAVLEWDGGKQILFENQKVAAFILTAKSKEKYQPAFSSAPEIKARPSQEEPAPEAAEPEEEESEELGPLALDERRLAD